MLICNRQILWTFLVTSLALLAPDIALANNTVGGLTEVFGRLNSASVAGTKTVVIASSLIGIALMIAGGIQLKKYADNPHQNPLGKPMMYILAGTIIFGVVATSETMQQTLFGTTTSQKGITWEQLK